MPAVPLGEAGRYVAAAYIVFFALVLIYVAIMAVKLSRVERELAELNELADRRSKPATQAPVATAPQTATAHATSTPEAAATTPPAGSPPAPTPFTTR